MPNVSASTGQAEQRTNRGHGAGHGTQSVCPVCLATIPAQRCRRGDDVVLTKRCPEHGPFETVIWRGRNPDFADWKSPKTPSAPLHCFTEISYGCPRDCGLCPDHRQHTCTALLEVTQRCNLCCPVCFSESNESKSTDPNLETIEFWFDRVHEAGGRCNIQLSGGEPTMRDDLAAIIELGRRKGFGFIQLNTNGLQLAETPDYARSLRAAGLASVFLQFDGVDDAVYERLRGRPLWQIKQRAVEHCSAAGLGVVLVPTVVPGVNDHALGDILRFALAAGPQVRGVHFQPVSYFGRYPKPPVDAMRITLPEVMRSLEIQSGGLVHVADFRPPACEHELCSFHGNYLRTAGGLKPLSGERQACCEPTIPAATEGARRSIAYTASQWAGYSDCCYKAPDSKKGLGLPLDQVLAWNFSISAMAFQDAWNLDLERLKGCCIHIVAEDGRLVPFCAYNLTSSTGEPLYRSYGNAR